MIKLSEHMPKEFQEAYQEIKNHTLVDYRRCAMIYQFVKFVDSLVYGVVAEVGVYKGGTARLIAKSTHKEVHIFDTFNGMPETDEEKDNVHKKGDFEDTTGKEVIDYLQDCDNISIHTGFFPDTFIAIDVLRFSFVHIDVDIYQSVKDCCDRFYPRMVTGGIMLFDDYGFPSCSGAKLAVDEFFFNKDNIIYLPTGQAFVIKI